MEFSQSFPVWDKLTPGQQQALSGGLFTRQVKKGTVLHSGSMDCTGLFLVSTGQLRAYFLSRQGREITLYRLFAGDICLFSASCILHTISFEVIIQAEKDTTLFVIPAQLYKEVMEASAPLANFTNQLMAARFSDVMWLMEQILWQSLDRRLAAFLLKETAIEGSQTLSITHEAIANHLGTQREVITRMLRYFQNEGMVKLSRGSVTVLAAKKLAALEEQP